MAKECSTMLIMDKGGGSIVGSIDTKRWLKLPRHSLKGMLIELMQTMLETWIANRSGITMWRLFSIYMHVHARRKQ